MDSGLSKLMRQTDLAKSSVHEIDSASGLGLKVWGCDPARKVLWNPYDTSRFYWGS